MTRISQQEAREFFRQLEQFSKAARRHCAKTEAESPNGHETYAKASPPDMCVLHYTAAHNFEAVISEFCNPAEKSGLSAHLVVARNRLPWAEPLLKDLPLVRSLGTTVVQCRLPMHSAVHATWTNNRAYGIEIMNCGEVRGEHGAYTWWPKKTQDSAEWTAHYPGTQEPWPLFGRLWETWPAEQLQAVALVGAYANALFDGSFAEHLILGHEHVQGVDTKGADGKPLRHDKRDCGPVFPMGMMRACIFGRDMQALSHEPWTLAAAWRCKVQAARQGLSGAHSQLTPTRAWRAFLDAAKDVPGLQANPRLCVSILDALGYVVRYSDDEIALKPQGVNVKSLEIFNSMAGLPHGHGFDATTCAALSKRVHDRFGDGEQEMLV